MKLWKARSPQPIAVNRRQITGPERKKLLEENIPIGVEVAGQWAWRILAIVAVLVVFGLLISALREIVVPFMVAILLAALLVPIKNSLVRHGWPKWLAVALVMVGTIAIIGGLVFLIVIQVRSGLPELQKQSVGAFDNLKAYLLASPLHLTDAQITAYLNQTFASLQKDSSSLLTGALSVGSTAGRVLTGTLLTLFATLFIVIDGRGIWSWIVRLFPRRARVAVNGAGDAGWLTLTTFVKVQIFVAFVDAVGIGIGAVILQLPLAIPIAIAVFLASFIPVVGAVVTGILAVFVALVYHGPVIALIMLGVVLLVQQVEGHVLQPLVMGSAVRVHPLAVVFSVAAGSFVAGIPGALFAVPLVATLNVIVRYIAGGEWRVNPRPQVKDVVSTNE